MNTTSAIQIKHATVLLTAQQIIEAVRQLDAQEREQVLQALREPAPAKEESYRYSVDALGTLWVTLAFRRGWGHGAALKLLTR